MSNDWIIERDEDNQKVRRQMTNAEQVKRDNRPPRPKKHRPDLRAAIQALIDGDTVAAQAAMDKME